MAIGLFYRVRITTVYAGRTKKKRPPPYSLRLVAASAHILPRCASMKLRAIVKPRPEPSTMLARAWLVRKHTRLVAKAYLEFLFSPQGQKLAAKHHFRPIDPAVLHEHESSFQKLELFTVKEIFGSWADAQKKHFVDGGVFDQIFKADKK